MLDGLTGEPSSAHKEASLCATIRSQLLLVLTVPERLVCRCLLPPATFSPADGALRSAHRHEIFRPTCYVAFAKFCQQSRVLREPVDIRVVHGRSTISHLGLVLDPVRPPLVQCLESGITIGLRVEAPRHVVRGPEAR